MRISFAILQVMIVYFGFIPKSSAQVRDSVLVHLSLPQKKAEIDKAFFVILRVESRKKAILEIPKEALWGYKPEGTCFYSLEVQKKTDGKYKDMKWNTRVDGPLSVDIDTLYYKDFREYTVSIDKVFAYNKGEYRVRVLCLFSSINDTKDVYTNWAYFFSTNR